MVLHLHLVKLVKGKFWNTLDQDCEFATKEGCLGLEVDFFFNRGSGENIVSDTDVVEKDALEFLSLGGCSEDLIFLKGLQIVHVKVTDNWARTGLTQCRTSLGFFKFGGCRLWVHWLSLTLNHFLGLSFTWGLCRFSTYGSGCSRLLFWHWHGSKVFSIYEVHRVSVDDTGVIILRLNFEIVRDQIDRALGDECRVRPVGLVSKTTTSTTASTAATTVSPSTVGRSTSAGLVMSSSGVLAPTVLMLLVLAVATTTHSLAIVRLLLHVVLLLVLTHVRLIWVPLLRLSGVLEATLILRIMLVAAGLLLLLLSLLLVSLVVLWWLHCCFEAWDAVR